MLAIGWIHLQTLYISKEWLDHPALNKVKVNNPRFTVETDYTYDEKDEEEDA